MANNISNVWKLMGIDPTTGTGTYKNRMGLGNAITRDNGIPLDLSTLHATYNDAVVYAATSSIAYVDQPIAAEGVLYLITEESQGKVKISSYRDSITGKLVSGEEKEYDVYLKRVGIVPTGDNASITVTAEGLVSLFGFGAAENGMLPVREEGKLVWKTLEAIGAGDGNDNTTYNFEVCEHKTGIVITPLFNGQPIMEGEGEEAKQVKYHLDLDVYTKGEVDSAIASAVEGVEAKIPTNNNQLTNGAGYQTADDVATAISGKANSADVYTKEQVDTTLADYAKTADVNTAINGINETLATKAAADDLTALADKVNAFLTGEGTEAALDSLQELIAYIDSHDDVDIAGILEDIQNLENKVVLGTDAEGKEYTTVKAYVEAAIAALAIGDYAKASDLADLAARVKTLEDIDNVTEAEFTAFKEENDDAIATAKQEAIDAAATAVTEAAYATKAELEAHAEAAAAAYVTKEAYEAHVEAAAKDLSDYKTEVARDYATKAELEPVTQTANNASTAVTNLEARFDEIVAVGGEPNAINTIKVNGTALTITNKVVDITDNMLDITGMGGYTELSGRVTTNANNITALTGQLGTTNGNVSDILTRLGALETEVGVEEKSRIDVLEGVLNGAGETEGLVAIVTGHGTKIGLLEAADTRIEKKADDNATAIAALQGKVDTGDLSVTDYVAQEIGKIEEYDDTEVRGLITAEAERATGVESGLRTDVNANATAIATLIGTVEGDNTKSARTIAAEEINRLIKASDDEGGETIENIGNLVDYVEKNAGEIAALITQANASTAALAGIEGTVKNYVDTSIAAIPAYTLPGATAEALGGIKSAADVEGKVAINKVYVDETTNVAEVKAISTDLLVQGTMTLVLNGGDAQVTA